MSTFYARRAQRLLSMDRRTGSQVSADVLAGRTQRTGSQSWRDLHRDAPTPPMGGLLFAAVYGGSAAFALWVIWAAFCELAR